MVDQAKNLRELIEKNSNNEITKENQLNIITVTSGKGGVGKSNFAANFALALKKEGKNPIILDADFGLSNIDLILGVRPKYNLSSYINNELEFKEIITKTNFDVPFISGGNGVKEMIFLDDYHLMLIASELSELSTVADTLIIDTGAGINQTVARFSQLANYIYLVITPDPASITDAYSLLKTFVNEFEVEGKFVAILNRVENKKEAEEVFLKIKTAAETFLKIEILYGGYIPFDMNLVKATKEQKPIFFTNQFSSSSIEYSNIAKSHLHMLGERTNREIKKESIVDKLRRIILKR